jgi:hypothetical protein
MQAYQVLLAESPWLALLVAFKPHGNILMVNLLA